MEIIYWTIGIPLFFGFYIIIKYHFDSRIVSLIFVGVIIFLFPRLFDAVQVMWTNQFEIKTENHIQQVPSDYDACINYYSYKHYDNQSATQLCRIQQTNKVKT